jgi:hypothetical protein
MPKLFQILKVLGLHGYCDAFEDSDREIEEWEMGTLNGGLEVRWRGWRERLVVNRFIITLSTQRKFGAALNNSTEARGFLKSDSGLTW